MKSRGILRLIHHPRPTWWKTLAAQGRWQRRSGLAEGSFVGVFREVEKVVVRHSISHFRVRDGLESQVQQGAEGNVREGNLIKTSDGDLVPIDLQILKSASWAVDSSPFSDNADGSMVKDKETPYGPNKDAVKQSLAKLPPTLNNCPRHLATR